MTDEIQPLLPFAPMSYIRENSWDGNLWLLTEFELEVVPLGTVLTSIMGNKKVVGKDKIDTDTRGGYLAYGLYPDQFKH